MKGPLTRVRGPCFLQTVSRPNEAPRRQRGFSAIELVLVVAATLIVAALGVSIYRTFSARAQVAAALDEAGAARNLVIAAFEQNGVPPADSTAAGIDATAEPLLRGTYVDTLSVHDGRIDLRFGAAADSTLAGKVLSLTPFETADMNIVWVCGNELPDVGLEPLGFAAGGPQAEQAATAIEDRYLPPACR